MKIGVSHLRQIIAEEVRKYINEGRSEDEAQGVESIKAMKPGEMIVMSGWGHKGGDAVVHFDPSAKDKNVYLIYDLPRGVAPKKSTVNQYWTMSTKTPEDAVSWLMGPA